MPRKLKNSQEEYPSEIQSGLKALVDEIYKERNAAQKLKNYLLQLKREMKQRQKQYKIQCEVREERFQRLSQMAEYSMESKKMLEREKKEVMQRSKNWKIISSSRAKAEGAKIQKLEMEVGTISKRVEGIIKGILTCDKCLRRVCKTEKVFELDGRSIGEPGSWNKASMRKTRLENDIAKLCLVRPHIEVIRVDIEKRADNGCDKTENLKEDEKPLQDQKDVIEEPIATN